MKIEINPLFGKISGKVSDFVFKQVNGKTIVCNKPLPRSKSSFSPSEINRQKRFGLNCKLSKCINHIEVYKPFWQKAANASMSCYNAILKANYNNVRHDGLGESICLTPDSRQIQLNGVDIRYDNGRIVFEINNAEIGIVNDSKKDVFVMIAGVLFAKNPLYLLIDEQKFCQVKSIPVKFIDDELISLSLELDNSQVHILESYRECSLYFGLIIIDKNGKVLKELSTFNADLKSLNP